MPRQRIKLDTLVVTLLLLGCLLFAGGFFALSWFSGVKSARESATAFHASTAEAVEAHIRAFLNRPVAALSAAAQARQVGLFESNNAAEKERFFVATVRAHPGVTNLSYATADGHYINAYRDWSDNEQVHVSRAGPDGQMRSWRLDANADRTELIGEFPGFFADRRPWYRRAAEQQGEEPLWFPAYLFHSGAALAIGLSQPLRNEEGQLLGVLASDTSLQEVSRLLAGLDLPAGSAAFLMNREGRLLADSSGLVPVRSSASGLQPLLAVRSDLPAVRPAAQFAVEAGFPGGPEEHLEATLEVNDRPYFVTLERVAGPHGLQLVFGISAPQAAYTAPLIAGIQQRLWLTVGLLAVGLSVGLWLARRLSRSLGALVRATSSIADGRTRAQMPRSRILELDRLADSFDAMQERLGNSLEELEQRVDARTEELARANARLSALSRTDSLTGVANRRAFDEALTLAWQYAQESAHALAVVMFDVDLFKDFNDRYGHPAGDRCLAAVAEELRSVGAERNACVARYGGEEFILLLPDCDEQEAVHAAEMLRRRVKALAIAHRDSPHEHHVTISAGVSVRLGGESEDGAQRLVDEADAALYEAKARGRNRVVVFDRVNAPV